MRARVVYTNRNGIKREGSLVERIEGTGLIKVDWQEWTEYRRILEAGGAQTKHIEMATAAGVSVVYDEHHARPNGAKLEIEQIQSYKW